MKTKIDTVHLVLRHKWYDMIDSGKKTEEYRAISTWRRRLGGSAQERTTPLRCQLRLDAKRVP